MNFIMRKIKRRKTMPWIIPVKRLVHNPVVRDWCRLPYPRHPKGCPNYGQKDYCPPKCPYITDVLNLKKPIYMVVSEFNLEQHMKNMKKKHPNWSEAQLRNVLYWQGTSKKILKERTVIAQRLIKTNIICYLPEAYGVNVYATAFHSGLKLEKIKNIKINRHISIIGFGK